MSLVHRCIPVEQMVARFMPNQRLHLTLFFFFRVYSLRHFSLHICSFSCVHYFVKIMWKSGFGDLLRRDSLSWYVDDDECINLSLSA